MGPSVQALENQYFTLRGSLSTMIGQGATSAQLGTLRGLIATSRNNYWTAIGRVFHDDDPTVEMLVSQMNAAQLSLDAMIQHLGDVAKVLDAITKAVNIGSQLAGMAVAM